jgi:photosystem II stability/assembly factor-like uncharacterized protein
LRSLLALALVVLGVAGCSIRSAGEGPVQATFRETTPPDTTGPAVDPTDVAMVSPRVGFLTTGGAQGRDAGRIQRTLDGGNTWTTLWSRKLASLEAISFADRLHGIVLGALFQQKRAAAWGQPADPVVLRTADGGSTWRLRRLSRRDRYALVGLEPRLLDTSVGYAVADPASFVTSGPLRTNDGGRTWHRVRFLGAVDFVDRSVGYAVGYVNKGDCSGIWRTSDGGRSWTRLRCSTIPLFGVDFVDRRHGFAAGGWPRQTEHGPSQIVLRTNDGGRRWHRVFVNRIGGFGHRFDPLVRLYFTDAMHGWARTGACKCCPSGPCSGEVMTTANGGRTWRRNGWAVQLAPGGRRSALLVPRCDEECGVIWRTRDGARTWQPRAGPTGLNVSRIHVTGRKLFLETYDGAIYSSIDGGRDWRLLRALSKPGAGWSETKLALRPGLIAVGGYVPVVGVSRDEGRTFERVRLSRDGREILALAFANARAGLVVTGTIEDACVGRYGGRTVYSTQDGGRSWRTLPRPSFRISDLSYTTGLAAALGDDSRCRQVLAVSRDDGRTWQTQSLGLASGCRVSVAPPDAVWLGCSRLLRVSADGGRSWSEVVGREDWSAVAAAGEREAWATFLRGKYHSRRSLWHTEDGGATWIQVWPRLSTP